MNKDGLGVLLIFFALEFIVVMRSDFERCEMKRGGVSFRDTSGLIKILCWRKKEGVSSRDTSSLIKILWGRE